ncbi:hypothetical protein [Clostridium sp. AM58-1XD]|uniref:hypothetical protein n=1 Tax=Clostridium sp. AM58-1XD TaxID=2292307 RepID=UPI000E556D3E|nr:hypothetical protein [Clostridium sp. AM58-1XD]RGZ01860.1 hypothetical protein DXA13_00730 [Clostridium sp. AM58-1XD]
MKCPFCNEEVDDQAVTCPVCGKELTQQPAEEQKEGGEPSADTEAAEAPAEPVVEDEGKEPVDTAPKAAPVQPEPAAELLAAPKKKSGKLVIGGAVIAAVAAVGVFGAVKMMEKDPKDVVIDAFKSVYSKDITYPSEEVFGWSEISKNSMEKNMEGGFSLTFDESSNPQVNVFAGSGFSTVSKSNVEDKKVYAQIGTQLANMDLLSFDIYLDQKEMMMSIPELSSKVFVLNYADDLEGQIQNSPYAGQIFQQSGIEPSAISDYFNYIWSFYDKGEERPFNLEALWERYKEGSAAINDFKAAMTVEKADAATFTVDGAETKCKGYDVVISQEAMINFVKTTSKFFMEDETLKKDVLEYIGQIVSLSGGASFDEMSPEEIQEKAWETVQEYADKAIAAMEDSVEDINMTVYVDKKGRLAAFNAKTNLNMEDGAIELALDVQLKGGSYITQNADVKLDVTGSDGTITISALKEGVYDKEQLTSSSVVKIESDGEVVTGSCDAEYSIGTGDYTVKIAGGNGTENGDLTIQGTISNLKKGESISIAMDTIGVNWNGEQLAVLSGEYYLKPLEGEVTIPEGEQLDVLAATVEEWDTVGQEINNNLQGLITMFFGLMMQ